MPIPPNHLRLISAFALVALAAQLLAACTLATPTSTATPSPTAAPAATAQATVVMVKPATPMPSPTPPPPTPTPLPARAATSLSLRLLQATASQYGRLELNVETDGQPPNPFDTAQWDLRVRFTSPGGKVSEAPAFWYQDFDRATLEPTGAPVWRARFTPPEPGAWTAQALLASPKLASKPARFNVSADRTAHGFVRLGKSNPRYFAFDDGSPFFAIGQDIAWWQKDPLGDYARWFGALGDNGGNATRVWMADWSFGIEWSDTGLGNYSGRMKQAWLLDQVFNLAQEHGIYIMLMLLNHGAFSQDVNPEWDANPYNAALGGPCANPGDFVTNPQARELFKRRMRYIAARWGYSPNLWAWEWWNEINWTPIHDDDLKPWLADMTAYLLSLDPNRHLVTYSTSSMGSEAIWSMPEMSFAQKHEYGGREPALDLPASYRVSANLSPGKPVVFGEVGASASNEDVPTSHDPGGVFLHNALWASAFSGFASTAMYWWWDTYTDPLNLWTHYKGLSEFLKGENLAMLTPSTGFAGKDAEALVLGGKTRALVWLVNHAYSHAGAEAAYEQALKQGKVAAGWTFEPPTLNNLTVTATVSLRDGAYSARWFSPQTAQWGATQRVRVQKGVLTLAAPALQRDLAVLVR